MDVCDLFYHKLQGRRKVIQVTPLNSYSAYRNYLQASVGIAKCVKTMSSGTRINSAADDAAGMVVSDGLKTKVQSIKQATKNVETSLSVLQTAEGGYEGLQALLNRALDLSLQAANQTNTETERQYLQGEYLQVLREIKYVTDSTVFNGTLIFGDPQFAYFPRTESLTLAAYAAPPATTTTVNTDPVYNTANETVPGRGTVVDKTNGYIETVILPSPQVTPPYTITYPTLPTYPDIGKTEIYNPTINPGISTTQIDPGGTTSITTGIGTSDSVITLGVTKNPGTDPSLHIDGYNDSDASLLNDRVFKEINISGETKNKTDDFWTNRDWVIDTDGIETNYDSSSTLVLTASSSSQQLVLGTDFTLDADTGTIHLMDNAFDFVMNETDTLNAQYLKKGALTLTTGQDFIDSTLLVVRTDSTGTHDLISGVAYITSESGGEGTGFDTIRIKQSIYGNNNQLEGGHDYTFKVYYVKKDGNIYNLTATPGTYSNCEFIKVDSSVLVKDTDYTISGNILTINPAKLKINETTTDHSVTIKYIDDSQNTIYTLPTGGYVADTVKITKDGTVLIKDDANGFIIDGSDNIILQGDARLKADTSSVGDKNDWDFTVSYVENMSDLIIDFGNTPKDYEPLDDTKIGSEKFYLNGSYKAFDTGYYTINVDQHSITLNPTKIKGGDTVQLKYVENTDSLTVNSTSEFLRNSLQVSFGGTFVDSANYIITGGDGVITGDSITFNDNFITGNPSETPGGDMAVLKYIKSNDQIVTDEWKVTATDTFLRSSIKVYISGTEIPRIDGTYTNWTIEGGDGTITGNSIKFNDGSMKNYTGIIENGHIVGDPSSIQLKYFKESVRTFNINYEPLDYNAAADQYDSEIITSSKTSRGDGTGKLRPGIDYKFTDAKTIELQFDPEVNESFTIKYVRKGGQSAVAPDTVGVIDDENIYNLPSEPQEGTLTVKVNGVTQVEGTNYTVDYENKKLTFVNDRTNGLTGDPTSINISFLPADWNRQIKFTHTPADYNLGDMILSGGEKVYIDSNNDGDYTDAGELLTAGTDYIFLGDNSDTIELTADGIAKIGQNLAIKLDYATADDNVINLTGNLKSKFGNILDYSNPDTYNDPNYHSEKIWIDANGDGNFTTDERLDGTDTGADDYDINYSTNTIILKNNAKLIGQKKLKIEFVQDAKSVEAGGYGYDENTIKLPHSAVVFAGVENGTDVITLDGIALVRDTDYTISGDTIKLIGTARLQGANEKGTPAEAKDDVPHQIKVGYTERDTFSFASLTDAAIGGKIGSLIDDDSLKVYWDGVNITAQRGTKWILKKTQIGISSDYINSQTGTNFKVTTPQYPVYSYEIQILDKDLLKGTPNLEYTSGHQHQFKIEYKYDFFDEFKLSSPVQSEIRNLIVTDSLGNPVAPNGYGIYNEVVGEDLFGNQQQNHYLSIYDTNLADQTINPGRQVRVSYEYYNEASRLPYTAWMQVGPLQSEKFQIYVPAFSPINEDLATIDISTVSGANNAIDTIKKAMATITNGRASVGSQASRLIDIQNKLAAKLETYTDAYENISSVDIAYEYIEYMKQKILMMQRLQLYKNNDFQPLKISDLLSSLK